MNDFVTLDKSHPDFQKYLLGEVSQNICAIPVQSQNINEPHERVTFELVDKANIIKPRYFTLAKNLFRIDLLSLTLAPYLAAAAIVSVSSQIEIGVFLQALFALIFLHNAVFCRNDYVDHIRGIDRVNEKSGSQIIQKGWLKAKTVRQLFFINLAFAFFISVPIFLAAPDLILVAVFGVLVIALGYSHLRWGSQFWLLSDLAIFLTLGPLISVASIRLLTGEWTMQGLLVGSYFGILSMSYVQIRQLISLVVDDEAKRNTMPVRYGFDTAKKIIFTLLAISALLGLMISLVMVVPVALTFLALKHFNQVTSPLSSALQVMPRKIVYIHLTGMLAMLAGAIVQLLFFAT